MPIDDNLAAEFQADGHFVPGGAKGLRENDYFFDSTKFEKAFNVKATDYRIGIAETMK